MKQLRSLSPQRPAGEIIEVDDADVDRMLKSGMWEELNKKKVKKPKRMFINQKSEGLD